MDASGDNVRVLLSNVRGGVHWQPRGGLLSFGSKYKDTEGVFVVDVDTLQVTRVWPHAAAHDWSPDGKQMAIIDRAKQDDIELTRPVIIDVRIDEDK
jgi:Tol biopolymer transport system component